MILTAEKMIFVTDPDDSNKYIENLRTEYNTEQYRIKIDRTLNPPYCELFRERKEDKRLINDPLFASSKLEKIVTHVNKNIQ